jgi:Mn2+/Fe2+ NRAMP family transporter
VENQKVSEQKSDSASVNPTTLGQLLASVGPGFVYVLTVLGTGDVVSNSAAGASYGYHLIWALGMTLVFRYVWVNTSAKYVLITGDSLMNGYRRVGEWIPWVVVISIFFIRHFTNQFLILITGSSAHMLVPLPTPWSEQIWSCVFLLIGFSMMFWGGYSTIESFCKLLVAVMGISLLIAALLSDPDPVGILKGTFIPGVPQAQGLYSAIFIVMALIGTEAGSTANLTYAYFIAEKGWSGASYLKQQRFDLAVGVLCLFMMGGLLQIAAAGTIHPLGIQVQDPEDMGRIFSQTQGRVGLIAFALGLWGSAFSSLIGFNTGYALVVTDMCRSCVPGLKRSTASLPRGYKTKRDPVYRALIIFWSFAPAYIIFTGARAVWLVLMVMACIVLVIPVLALSLLKMTNDKSLMGKYKNGWFTNSVLVLLTLIAIYSAYLNGFDLWNKLTG